MMQNNLLVIVGAGPAGLACAISAAGEGVAVVLAEKTSRLGGTVTQSLIHTIAGLYDADGEYINQGLPTELAERLLEADPHTRKRKIGMSWVLNADPSVYEQVVEEWVRSQPDIRLFRNAELTRIEKKSDSVDKVALRTNGQEMMIEPGILIDATGGADIVRMTDPDKVVPGDALGGIIIQLGGINAEAFRFPKNLMIARNIREAAGRGILPRECANTWFDRGVYENEVYVKMNLPPENRYDISRLKNAISDFLREFPGFSDAAIIRTGAFGFRDSGRIKGEYCLTLADIRKGRTFSDSVCRCCWPVEYWEREGEVTLEYLPAKQFYEIPLSALQVAGMKNLWAVGRCLSAEPMAQSSARVSGACWAMGDKLGHAAAKYLKDTATGRGDKVMKKNMNLSDIFFQNAEKNPEHPLIIGPEEDHVHTYGDFQKRILSLSEKLGELGVNSGECIGLHYPSGSEYIALTYAIWSCDACAVPIPVELTTNEKEQIFRNIRIDAVISAENIAADIGPLQKPDALFVTEGAVFIPLDPFREHPDGFADINSAFIRFTSGTTGDAKGVVLSHETIYERIHAANRALQIGPDDRILWMLSMAYHFAVSIVAYLSFGATIILCKNYFGATVVKAASDHKATILYAAPTHYELMTHARGSDSLPNVRLAIATTTTLRSEVADAFYKSFGTPLNETYGIIEIGLPFINTDKPLEKRGSVGRILPDYEMRTREVAGTNDLQEISVRGVGLLDAYYEPWTVREQILEKNGGWFSSGDLGYVDDEGYLYIRGRSKEMISVGGMKFFPRETEAVLESHPAVREACVFGYRDKRRGEVPHAHIVIKESVSQEELNTFCSQHLAVYKIPEQYIFVDTLLKTASGKVIRNPLKLS